MCSLLEVKRSHFGPKSKVLTPPFTSFHLLSCSMLEVYNEALRDLLAAGPEAAKLDVSLCACWTAWPVDQTKTGTTTCMWDLLGARERFAKRESSAPSWAVVLSACPAAKQGERATLPRASHPSLRDPSTCRCPPWGPASWRQGRSVCLG